MDKYIGCKLVEATPAVRFRNGDLFNGEIKDLPNNKRGLWCEEGYRIVYEGGYESWSPKDVFEKSYIKVAPNEKLKSGVSISSDMVKNFIKSYEVFEPDNKTTVVHAVLKNGFTITESSSCVDPENYSKEIGVNICMERIADKIWELLGFMLQTAFKGVNN